MLGKMCWCFPDARHYRPVQAVVIFILGTTLFVPGLRARADTPSKAQGPSSIREIPDPAYSPKRGDHAVLFGFDEKRDTIYEPSVAKFNFAYEEYWKSLDIDDDDGIAELEKKGLVFDVPNGTEVLVLELEPFPAKDPRADAVVVRITNGRFKSLKVWVAEFNVVKLAPNPRYTPPALKVLPRNVFPPPERPRSWPEIQEGAAQQKSGSYLGIAQSLEKQGKTAAALNFYRDIVKEFPKRPEAKQAQLRIDALTKKASSKQ